MLDILSSGDLLNRLSKPRAHRDHRDYLLREVVFLSAKLEIETLELLRRILRALDIKTEDQLFLLPPLTSTLRKHSSS
jgi:hypothetical protein